MTRYVIDRNLWTVSYGISEAGFLNCGVDNCIGWMESVSGPRKLHQSHPLNFELKL